MSHLKVRAPTDGVPARYPGFAIPDEPPREGCLPGTAGVKPKLYAARAKLLFADNVSRVFYEEPEDLGTQL